MQFGGVAAVDGVSLTLHDNEILGLVGPNGSGKTTFLNALTGVVDADRDRARRWAARSASASPAASAASACCARSRRRRPTTHLTCLEDVLLSTTDRQLTGHHVVVVRAAADEPSRTRAGGQAAIVALERVGLADLAEAPTVAAVVRAAADARARTGGLRRAAAR